MDRLLPKYPKVSICVPIMGGDVSALAEAARSAAGAADLIEIRIDSLDPAPNPGLVLEALCAIRSAAGNKPLLFTLRTSRDGGPGTDDPDAYVRALRAAAESGMVQGIDVELSVGREIFGQLCACAKQHGCVVIGSAHAFTQPEDPAWCGERLMAAERFGADVAKVAVMAKTLPDALEQMTEMAKAAETLHCPTIPIVMGPHGLLARTGCGLLGGCLTFGTVGAASAPGQIDALRLRRIIDGLEG